MMKRLVNRAEQNENLRRGVFLLPNLLTTGGLFSGFYSIVATMNGSYLLAAWFVLIAAIFDGLDGKVARLTNTTSKFGVEYDSLSDLVAFGVAPALLMYAWALKPFGKMGWLAAFLYVVCGALRLARFNVQITTVESKRFVGLPIPGAAWMASSLVIIFHHMGGEGTIKKVSVLVLIYVLAALMVSNVRYYAFKDPELFRRQPFGFLVLAIIFIIVIVAEPEIMIFALACIFVSSGPIGAIIQRFMPGARRGDSPPPVAS